MPDPMAPPTPPVPLEALLAREDLGLRRVAGPDDPGTVVHWAQTSEMADPYPYLLGGELLLSAGVHIPEGAGAGYFDAYVSRIVAAGGAALGFGLAPVHEKVPTALAEACEMRGLPLLEVPPGVTFSGVARAVWQLMAQARTAELRRVTEAQQGLATAAARPDPVRPVLHQLAQRLGGWAVLYAPDTTEVAHAGTAPPPQARAALTALAGVVRPVPRPAAGSSASSVATGVPPREQGREQGKAGGGGGGGPAAPAEPEAGRTTSDRPRPTPAGEGGPATAPKPEAGRVPGDRRPVAPPASPAPASASDTAAGSHLATYALGSGNGFVLGVASPHRNPGDHTIASVGAALLSLLTGRQPSGAAARSSALVRLLLGTPPEDVVPLLGAERWHVVHARPDGPTGPDPLAVSALGTALGSDLVDPSGEAVRVLVPAGRPVGPLPGWTLGVSPAAPPDWPAADTRAARALARARATRVPLVRHGDRPALTDLVPPPDADAHARALLAPIADAPALTDTLRTWLSLHGSWDRTAVALSVHRNTVRQRIARCAALLAADLDDPDVRMELWFALRRT
ncbi:PucR family transcriptional regulator [Streptomyces sp. CHD11]|uniref:PucR family transcriptional regulator n=1 Tax=Streptomyces sp. CHD11 TaxID=2741325 RepID=UPI001BFC4F7D|nr:PucR family transcriptional regulator [Streptomyces sp. CHD11]MBT3151092.1 PucR family transcriptional regulator [Streptomyces sp. CHD11]